jgi:NitT/TauT family transport system ATP-binding protein
VPPIISDEVTSDMTKTHSPDQIELPSYKHQAPEVAAHFAEVRQRPVVMTVGGVGRVFESVQGPVTALRNIEFEVHQREFISVIGPSGCGKSTLIRIVSGLESCTSGAVLIDGKPVVGPGPDRGMVFQAYTLFPWLTVKQNVMFGPNMKGSSKDAAEKQALEWLRVVGLTKFSDHYPSQLSGGMKQRVAIARALAMQPRVLLMDEPFAALDALTRRRMQEELLRLWDEAKLTLLFVTHSIEEALIVGNRILLLTPHPGRVRAEINSHQYTQDSTGRYEFQQSVARIHRLLFEEEIAQ